KNIDKPIRAYRVRLDGVPTKAKARSVFASQRRKIASVIAIFALLIVLATAWWIWSASRQTVSATPSIAVLPFANLSGDPANQRIADGITEDTITDLSRFREFTVIAKDSTEVYRDKPVDVRQIGRDLNIDYALKGSFQREGDQVRISAQLIDV